MEYISSSVVTNHKMSMVTQTISHSCYLSVATDQLLWICSLCLFLTHGQAEGADPVWAIVFSKQREESKRWSLIVKFS